MLSLDANGTDDELLRIALDGFPPRNVADFLVDTFFHTVEANYYYMDRDRFKDRLQRCYADMTPEGVDHDASFVCLVLIVFAMGSQFADLRAPAQLISSMAVSKHGPGMVFYVKAKLLLSDVITTGSLESIQACFLIGLFLLPSNTSDLSYVYHGMALKMAISAGLHREIADASGLDQRVMHVRNRLWWSLYTSERRLTIILDRPESIREEDIDAPFPEFSPDLDPPHAGDNIYNLQASIQLTRIYNRAVRLGKAMDFADPKAEHSVADIRQDLENWARRLPSNLQLNKLSPEQKSFRGAVHLHMNYNQIVIYMGRAALLRRIQAHLHRLRDEKHSDSATPESAELNGRQEAEERLSQDCVNAAYRIIDYVRYLYELNRLARFSFTDFHCCTSAAIIVLIHEVIKRHPLFNTHIAAIMQCMQFMASGCENARISLRVIQNIHSTTTALKDKHPPAPLDEDDAGMENGDRSEETQRTGYEQWETWMSEARNWNISSRKETEVSRLAATTELTGGWRVEPTPLAAEYTDNAIGHQVNFGALSAGSPPFSRPGLPTGLLYNWPEDLNSLGLSAFGGLPFHAGTGM
ncbi:hypothetical protein GQ53DRAFT_204272 [Thozetella sp. PMI_491]|nr:hypothetical protein GQ53DRAFT_204272 [Thozetella sp. PMI_491]